jgi:hypothetical protein
MPSSGTCCRVDLVWTDGSKERNASIFRVEKSASEEPAWAGGCRLRGNRLVASNPSMETGSFSEMLCSLEYRALDRIQNLSNPECYTPSSEPFRILQNNSKARHWSLFWVWSIKFTTSYTSINSLRFVLIVFPSMFRSIVEFSILVVRPKFYFAPPQFVSYALLILWCVYPLLGNDSVNTLPRKQRRATIGHPLQGNGSIHTPVSSAWSAQSGYKEVFSSIE